MKKIFQIVFRLANIVFAVLLLLSTLAGNVAPSRSAWITLLGYAYQYLLLINFVCVLIWLCFRRLEALISVVAIAIRWSFLPLFVQLGGNAEYDGSHDAAASIKLMSFNTHAFYGCDGTLSNKTGACDFLEMLRKEQPDVLALQEFTIMAAKGFDDSLANLGYKYHHNTRSNDWGEAIYSKRPFDYVGTIDESKLFVDIMLDNNPVRIYCVHMASYAMVSSDAEALEKISHGTIDSSAKVTVHKLVATARKHEREWKDVLQPHLANVSYPVILAGDFNDPPSSYLYHRVSNSFIDSYTEQGRGFCTTYHGPFPAFRIDHVFHSDAIKVLSYKRVKSDISDHYPLVVTFTLK